MLEQQPNIVFSSKNSLVPSYSNKLKEFWLEANLKRHSKQSIELFLDSNYLLRHSISILKFLLKSKAQKKTQKR